jgi:hypothetical protein
MSLSISSLLLHSPDVPPAARAALLAASSAPAHERISYLEAAARSLYRDANLDCVDARELVGLATGG